MGKHGLVAPRIGLGTMGMSAFYIQNPKEHEEESLRTISRALELGCNFLDTAWVYQSANADGTMNYNEELVGKAIKEHGRDKFIIATKFGISFAGGQMKLISSEADIRQQLSESLARLGTDYVDLYYQHRQDPATPIEEVARVLETLRQEGKIRYIGFSEITAGELRRASSICPVTAIQMEYSLQSREIEASVLPAARELGVAVVAYSPLGRGLLSRRIKGKEGLGAGDWRSTLPRLVGEHGEENLAACDRFEEKAAQLGLPPATLALAWLLSKGEDIFPIPGSKAVSRLEQNILAASVVLTKEQWEEVEAAVPQAKGARYPDAKLTFEARDV